MKRIKNSKIKIGMILFLVMAFWGIMPRNEVKASETGCLYVEDIPLQYDISTRELTINFSVEAEAEAEEYLAYTIVDCADYSWDDRNKGVYFEQSTKTMEKSVTLTIPLSSQTYIIFYLVDVDGNYLKDLMFLNNEGYCYSYYYIGNSNFDDSYSLLEYKDADIEYINGENYEDFDYNISFEKGILTFDSPDDIDRWYYKLYRDDEEVLGIGYISGSILSLVEKLDVSYRIDESGTYEIVFQGVSETGRTKVLTATYEYTRPEQQMDSVSYVRWLSNEAGVCSFPQTDAEKHWAYLEFSTDGGNTFYPSAEYGVTGNCYVSEDGTAHVDFSNSMTREGAVYRVKVKAVSDDVEEYAHSDYVYSSIYDPATAGEDIEITLQTVLEELGVDSVENIDADSLMDLYNASDEEEKAQIYEALKGGFDELAVNELKVAMQTDSEIRETVAAIESMSGVNVQVEVADNLTNIIDADSVGILGAALNASEGVDEVTLKVTKEATPSRWNSGGYREVVSLGITLEGVENVSTELAVPVRLAIPIPQGVDIAKLAILHMNADGTVEEKFAYSSGYEYDSQTRIVYFTITHFSTFILAEEVNESEGNTGGTDSGNTSGTQNGVSSDSVTGKSRFVALLYENVLERYATQSEIDSWVQELNNGKTGAEVAYGFIFSQEFTNKNLSDSDYVERLYMSLMGRASDEGGKNDWVTHLYNGVSRLYVFRQFVNSQEFTNLCNEYGIVKGDVTLGEARDANYDVTRFVARNYREFLGRNYDVSGLNDWTYRINNRVQTMQEIASGFVFSQECTNMNLSNEEYVQMLYRGCFDRPGDEAGVADWVSQLNSGTKNREEVFWGFANSQEFANMVASYGL